MGSFLNVVAFRTPHGISLLKPPSTCPQCDTPILARDNIPLFGWILLGGKCRACRAAIPARYPLVELATGALWALAGYHIATLPYDRLTNILLGLLSLLFVSAMIVTFLVDWDYQIILDEISLGGTFVAILASVIVPATHNAYAQMQFAFFHPVMDNVLGLETPLWVKSVVSSLVGAVVGLVFSLSIYYLGNFMFRKQIAEAQKDDPEIDSALGLGDVKLMVMIGAFMGWLAVVFTFLVGSLIGALFGSVMKIVNGSAEGKTGFAGLLNRWETGNSVIAFGPFLVIAALIFHFWGDYITFFFRA